MEPSEIEIIENALENLPQEAKDFLYKGDFEKALTKIENGSNLTKPQRGMLDFHLTRIIALIEQRDVLLILCQEWNFTGEQMQKFIATIDECVFVPLVEATNYTVEEEIIENSISNTPSFSSFNLDSLGEKLTQSRLVIPSLREQKIDSTDVQSQVKSFDPYRELPEK